MILALAAWLAVGAGAAEFNDTIKGIAYRAVVSDEDVKIYAILKGKPYVVYFHPCATERPRLDETLSQKRFTDFFKDGSRALVYRTLSPQLGRATLYIVRYQDGRFARAGAFADGRLKDIDNDGRFEIITRTAPLGRLLSVSCPNFSTTAMAALKTDILGWKGGKFVSVADRHPKFFEDRIAEDERALAALEPQKMDRAGDYVSASLTLYFDYAALGQARRGWDRLTALVDPNASLPGAAACVAQIKADLRQKLSIPADWP